jgi:hypothetical protein
MNGHLISVIFCAVMILFNLYSFITTGETMTLILCVAWGFACFTSLRKYLLTRD